MVYECEHCGYLTKKQSNFLRHKNRKNPCGKMNNGNINRKTGENISFHNRNSNSQYDNANLQNDNANSQNSNAVKCLKCFKILSNKYSLKRHLDICTGVDILTCPTCLKRFSSISSKNNHIRNIVCSPPPPPPPQQPLAQTINNITNNINTTNIENQTNNNINNNIQINVFGKEDLNYLLNDKDILQKLKSFGKSGIYGLPKIINDVHFNKDKPENNTLIKPDEYGNGVMIMNDDKEWEYREFEDIRDDLISTIIKYFKAYNTVKNNLGVKLIEKKERNIIKNIAYELMSLEGSVPQDLFQELDMNDEDIEESEDELKNKLRKFDKSTMKNIHQRTSTNFKKENGSYIKK